MFTYTAAQAISPAIERTKLYLFSQFRLGRFLKLALVAMLTDAGSGGYAGNFPTRMFGGSQPSSPSMTAPQFHWPAMSQMIWIGVVSALILLPIGILLSYLLIRLRFSFFDCVVSRQDQIAPAWRKYHRQALRYLGFSVCVGLAFWIVMIPVGYALYLHFKPLFTSLGHPPTFMDFLPLIGVAVPLFLLLAIAGAVIDIVMNSFVLPRMALEDAAIGDALREVWSDVSAEPGQFFLFVLLRFLITIAAGIIGMIAIMIPSVIVVLIGVVLAALLKSASTALAVVLGIPALILVFCLFALAIIGLSGTIGTFRRNYALVFYAVRYPALAAEMWPHLPAPFLPPAYEPPVDRWPGDGSGPAEGV